MKKIILALSLSGALLGATPLYAEESAAPAAAPVATATVEASATPAPSPEAAPVAAPAEAAPAAAAPTTNKGDDAFLMICSAFVILMSIPGLALFYGGLVRKKNMLSVLKVKLLLVKFREDIQELKTKYMFFQIHQMIVLQ